MSDHLSKQFDIELAALRSHLVSMAELVRSQIERAVQGLVEQNMEMLSEVANAETRVNDLQMDIDEECTQILVRRQPAARDLRVIMTITKMTTDLERIGDEAKKIARIGRSILQNGYKVKVRIEYIAQLTINMLSQAIEAFLSMDTKAVLRITEQDQLVDNEFLSILRQLITFVLEDPRNISHTIDALFIAKAIERIGDHAENMAEYVIYMVEGTDVRHTKFSD